MRDRARERRGGAEEFIRLRGVRQNNLRGLNLDLPVGKLIAVTGVSGSGKSSLAFDTLYAEGQRRYVECLSSYARQFMQRLPAPRADAIEGIPPTIALRQGRRMRSSRATVATLTEVLDYFKIVFAATATPTCPSCGEPMARRTAAQLTEAIVAQADGRRAVVAFALRVVGRTVLATARRGLAAAGLYRALVDGRVLELEELEDEVWLEGPVHIVQDRLRIDASDAARLHESIDQAMQRGDGAVELWIEGLELRDPGLLGLGAVAGLYHYRARDRLRCPACDIELPDPVPALFSYNSPLGACPSCNGFGRVTGIDWDRCIPDPSLSLRGSSNRLSDMAIRPWATRKTARERRQLHAFCDARGIDTSIPWRELPEEHRELILEGDPGGGGPRYYSLRRWFAWLESRAYKMHVRVQLARYRSYSRCADCDGTRLTAAARAWRWEGLTLPQWLALPVAEVDDRLARAELGERLRSALLHPWRELRRRVGLLRELGLGYLGLERPGRTLSGGELQRVQLVTALASGLSRVLYVLDEPSVGLHPRDSERLVGVLRELCAAGNTVLMVEHDPGLIRAADHLVDIGPGPGEQGGRVVFSGPPAALHDAPPGATADFLCGRRAVLPEPAAPLAPRAPASARQIARRARDLRRRHPGAPLSRSPWITLRGVRARNLRAKVVRLALGKLNAVCGVSGSGKSTLIEEVLYRGLLRRLGRATDPPGACEAIDGAEEIAGVVLLEQAPIAGSTRANCATYLKAWDVLRRRLAAEPLSRERGYTASTFSFNTRGGRCEVCAGAGVELIDMQFLSDVRIPCEVCGGTRFARDVLQVRHRGRNVGELLEMTASEVAADFADDGAVARPFAAMAELGLGYLRLGQSLATLSGGESQRLRIAHHLLCARTHNTLLLLDEPSTGLHLADVAVLIENLRRLVAAGNTVVLIEHHLDLVRAADHVVELGPEGGPGGGEVVFSGTPAAMMQRGATLTSDYLRAQVAAAPPPARPAALPEPSPAPRPEVLEVRGARVHNLRDLDLDLPTDRFTVITGLSGSGKSSLAFDVVFSEGQRRFLDVLSPYARQYLPPVVRPDVDSLRGLPPTVAIAQRTTRGGLRSTVATLTDLQPYLRLLYARCGRQRCPRCGEPVGARSAADLAASIRRRFRGAPLYLMVPVVRGRKGRHEDLIARSAAAGRAWIHIDGRLLRTDSVAGLRRYAAHDIDEVVARLPLDSAHVDEEGRWRTAPLGAAVQAALAQGDGTVLVREAGSTSAIFARDRYCGDCDVSVEAPDPLLFSFTSRRGWCPTCTGSGVRSVEKGEGKKKRRRRGRRRRATRSSSEQAGHDFEKRARQGESEPLRLARPCPDCGGSRLRREARAVSIAGLGIDALTAMTPGELSAALGGVQWSDREAVIAAPIIAEVQQRCRFLIELGLGYLAPGRGAVTLSGGESQRLRLAAQLGSPLRGVLYVLDEPSIGLHAADQARLLAALDTLRARGNGLLVVEHDEATIRRADHVVELGPGGGDEGGLVLRAGPLQALLDDPDSPTGRVLRDPGLRRSRRERRPPDGAGRIDLRGARRHNLRDLEVTLLRGRLNVVSGVSGSGKSTLVQDLLVHEGNALLVDPEARPEQLAALEGLEGIGRIVAVDQRPIGRTPRSCPATYLKVMDPLRKFFALLPDARARGMTPSTFSFNVPGGRCEVCKGAGQRKLEMSFLPAGFVRCEACEGRRYDARTLLARYRGASIADVLELPMAAAAEHFRAIAAIHRPLAMATRVGLGYLRTGQGSHTLSGGEAQRIKIVAELAKRRRAPAVYVLDEPTTGLHLADQRKLLGVLHELVDRGDTLVVIEHNLDLIAEADWLVDLGPGAGPAGGRLCWQGTVADYIGSPEQTPTAVALRRAVSAQGAAWSGTPLAVDRALDPAR